ncbi:unnamed protein product [Ectocarpus sp. 13 AM-2016]
MRGLDTPARTTGSTNQRKQRVRSGQPHQVLWLFVIPSPRKCEARRRRCLGQQ